MKKLMNEIDTVKIKENISEVQIQEQLIYFTTEFKNASKFMKNAADLIIDGASNSTPSNETIENTKHALGLADQHIVLALSTLNEVEVKLGLAKKIKTGYYFKIKKRIAIHILSIYNVFIDLQSMFLLNFIIRMNHSGEGLLIYRRGKKLLNQL